MHEHGIPAQSGIMPNTGDRVASAKIHLMILFGCTSSVLKRAGMKNSRKKLPTAGCITNPHSRRRFYDIEEEIYFRFWDGKSVIPVEQFSIRRFCLTLKDTYVLNIAATSVMIPTQKRTIMKIFRLIGSEEW